MISSILIMFFMTKKIKILDGFYALPPERYGFKRLALLKRRRAEGG
jgi:hypothetical protein